MRVLTNLNAIGYDVVLEGDEIVCRWHGPGEPEAKSIRPLIEELRRRKTEAVEWLRCDQVLLSEPAHWPKEWREQHEERAAIIEHDGGRSRLEADLLAKELVRAAFRRKGGQPV